MAYKIEYDKSFAKDLKKIDIQKAKIILGWIKKNIVEIDNPKEKGKALKGDLIGFWRYRIGDYRLIVEIKDTELVIICLAVAHRKDIYNLQSKHKK